MAFDPNLYAIQLEMGIDSTQAVSSLDDLERKAVNVEQSLNKAMNATLAQTAVQVTEINAQLEMANSSVADFGVQQTLNIEKFNDHTKEHLKYTEELEKEIESLKEIRDLYAEQFESFKLSSQVQQSIEKTLKSQSKSFLEMMSDSVKAYLGFDTGKKIIQANGEEVKKTTVSHSKFETALNKINGAFQKLSKEVQSYWVWIKELTEATERFVTVNNRTYGSIHEIIGQAQLTALSFGLITDKALDATEALINVGVARESLEELTVALVQTNRVTGLSMDSLAELTRQYEATGEGVEGYKQTIQSVMAAQRAFNLNTGQAQKVLDLHNASLFKMTNMFGKDAPAQILKSMLAMQAMTRDVGAGAETLENYAKLLTATGEDLLTLHGQIGGNPFADQKVKEENVLNFYDRYAKALAKIKDTESAQYRALANNFKIQMDARGLDMNMVLTLSQLRRQAGMEGKTAIEIQEIYNQRLAEGRTITGEYETGMGGLVAQWNRLRDIVIKSFGPLINFIADGMWPWLLIAQKIVQTMFAVISAIVKFYKSLEAIVPGLKQARQVVQLLIGGIVLLVGGIVLLAASIASAVSGLISFVATIIIAGGAVLGLGGSIATFFTGAAVSINTFLTRVAAGLARLGTMLTPLIGPMLAFGATILMVGVGTFLLAKAFEAVAQYGWKGVAMFFAFMAIVALFGLAIVRLGYLSIAAAPGLLALGAAVLMIGAGVALMVGSVALLVMAFTGLLNAITPDIKDRIFALTEGLVYLASYGPRIAIGLGTIGFAFAAVVVPLLAASVALMGIGLALNMIANFKAPTIGEELKKFAEELKASAGVLNEAGLALIPASVAIGAGAIALLGSALTLGLAAGVMMVAGLVLVGAGALFAAGSGLFFTGATMFKTGAEFVMAGATTLIAGARLIPEATALLIIASADLLAAGLSLLPGSITLAASASYLALAGVALLLATPSLMAGAIGFYFAASAISRGIEKLEKSSIILYRFAIAARALERLSFGGMRQGINDLGSSAAEIDKYVSDMEKASISLQNVRFDVTGFSTSIVTAADVLTAAVDKLQIPIDKLSSNINEMVSQIDKLVAQEARINELGSNLTSAMPDKPQDLQQPAEFKKADGNTEMVNNIIEVKNDSSEMVALLKRLVVLAEGDKDVKEAPEFGSLMSSTSPNRRLREIGIDI